MAKNNGRVVGLAWLQGTTNKAVMLAGIMVTKEFQEQGVGRLLDKCREEVARKLGVKRLEMYIDGNNNKSNDWHLGQGYSVIRTYLGKKL